MRYLPLTPDDRTAMLAAIGAKSIDDLFVDVPQAARREGFVDLPRVAGELEVERALGAMAAKNAAAGAVPFFCGAGAYKHHVPATVDHIIQRSEFLTSYTPYQPEIAQGTLQYLYEFQTQVANLTGMEVANASLYDGSTAMAEGVLMATRATRRNKAVISGGVHPHYVRATETVVHAVGVETQVLPAAVDAEADVIARIGPDTACVVVQTPNVFGTATDVTKIAEAAHAAGALLIVVVTEAVSMGLLKSPGEMGADIVAAEGQSIGNALNFGGPYVGLFATREKLVRQMPGRLTGETVDADGERGFVLTLSTREQHIRRDKATSNICTNSGLCTLAFTIHMSLLGETGLRKLALLNHEMALATRDALAAIPGVEVLTPRFFNEFAIRVPGLASAYIETLAGDHSGYDLPLVLAGVPYSRLAPHAEMDDIILIAATETTTDNDIAALAKGIETLVRSYHGSRSLVEEMARRGASKETISKRTGLPKAFITGRIMKRFSYVAEDLLEQAEKLGLPAKLLTKTMATDMAWLGITKLKDLKPEHVDPLSRYSNPRKLRVERILAALAQRKVKS